MERARLQSRAAPSLELTQSAAASFIYLFFFQFVTGGTASSPTVSAAALQSGLNETV